jgi:hypothetical protein
MPHNGKGLYAAMAFIVLLPYFCTILNKGMWFSHGNKAVVAGSRC